MNTAWETTQEDLVTVLNAHGKRLSDRMFNTVYDKLNTDDIEAEALAGDSMEEQTAYAYKEIEKQLKDMEIIYYGSGTKF